MLNIVVRKADGTADWHRRGATGDRAGRRDPLSRYFRARFGAPVYRVTVDGGFTCPNVDGLVAVGGCVYCDNRSFSPNRRQGRAPIAEQIARGVEHLRRRYRATQFIAYFQAATNTYAPVDRLRRLYDAALAHPQVVGLAIGTRPDCVGEPVLALIREYASRCYVCLELGLQSIHDRSLAWMNRGHDAASFVDAVKRCSGMGFDVCAHVILGLPGESRAEMNVTADALAALPIQGVKIHNLHVVRNTPLEAMYRRGEIHVLSRLEYVAAVCDFLERLPADVVIHRLTGDAPPDYLVAPTWCLEKQGLIQDIETELVRRGTWQGSRWNADSAHGRCVVRRALPVLPTEVGAP